MAFLPLLIPLIAPLASVATAAISLRQSQKSANAAKESQTALLAAESERVAAERTAEHRRIRARSRLAAGQGQGTILGGNQPAEIGRATLLGQ